MLDQVGTSLTAGQKTVLNQIFITVDAAPYGPISSSIDQIVSDASLTLMQNELQIIVIAASVAKSSTDYWSANISEWHSLADLAGIGYKTQIDWGLVVGMDVAAARCGWYCRLFCFSRAFYRLGNLGSTYWRRSSNNFRSNCYFYLVKSIKFNIAMKRKYLIYLAVIDLTMCLVFFMPFVAYTVNNPPVNYLLLAGVVALYNIYCRQH